MNIVIDTNIFFSGMLNTNSQIANIILGTQKSINFYSVQHLQIEIQQHASKLQNLAGYSDMEFSRIYDIFASRIKFINEQLIPSEILKGAYNLCYDIDEDDIIFIALTEFINGYLWSGDKKLKQGLINKNWNKFISTSDIFQYLKDHEF
jgi:predicted nucleic acid-binding protein